MENIATINDLLIYHLRDVYDAEDQQMDFLPKVKSAITSYVLKDMVDYYSRELQKHFRRLERIFKELNKDPVGKRSMVMEILLRETNTLIKISNEGEVLDAGLSIFVQHMNLYEIAAYGASISFAKAVEKHNLAATLLETMREKKQYDLEVSNLTDEMLLSRSEEK